MTRAAGGRSRATPATGTITITRRAPGCRPPRRRFAIRAAARFAARSGETAGRATRARKRRGPSPPTVPNPNRNRKRLRLRILCRPSSLVRRPLSRPPGWMILCRRRRIGRLSSRHRRPTICPTISCRRFSLGRPSRADLKPTILRRRPKLARSSHRLRGIRRFMPPVQLGPTFSSSAEDVGPTQDRPSAQPASAADSFMPPVQIAPQVMPSEPGAPARLRPTGGAGARRPKRAIVIVAIVAVSAVCLCVAAFLLLRSLAGQLTG